MVNFPIALLFFSVGGFNLIKTRKNCFRYLKLMSPLHAAICTSISYTLWVEYYLKNNYLTLRSKVKVPRMSKTKMLWPGQENTILKQLCDLDWPWWQRSRSHKGHYGMRHTALWSCTHVLEWSSNHNLIFKFPGLTLTNQITDLFKVSVIPASILAFQKIAYSSQHRFSFCKKLYLLFPPSTP
jgi:hypothetical protein